MVNRRSKSTNKAMEKRYDELRERASAAAVQGRFEQALLHSEQALEVCRLLYDTYPDNPKHRSVLAAALYNHAGRMVDAGRTAEAQALARESEGHYRELAAANPREYIVRLADTRLRTARALLLTGERTRAEALTREVLRAYRAAPTDDPVERDLAVARAHIHLGRCLLTVNLATALEEFDAGLFAAERVREEAGISATDFSWLATAPASFRYAAPEWSAGAVCAMEIHDAAGRWDVAADAANIAVRVSAGLAAIGGEAARARFEAIMARAQAVWAAAEHPLRTAAERAGPFGRVMVGGTRMPHGPSAAVDIEAMLALAGWENPPTAAPA